MATAKENSGGGAKGGYRVYRFPEAARRVIAGRPPGETIRSFVERLVEERLPGLVDALVRLGLTEPGPAAPAAARAVAPRPTQ